MSKLLCPKCMKSVTVPDDFAGGQLTCPACSSTFEPPVRYNPTVLADSEPPKTAAASNPPGPAVSAAAPTTAATSTKPLEPPSMSLESRPDRPSPPPGLVPPTPPLGTLPSMPTTPPTLPLGYTKSHGIVLSPHVIAWLPAILLAVALISTFFPWVGTYLGGSPADSQGPWRATFGAINRNYALEKKIETPLVWLEKVQSNWELMLPFLFALIAAFALSWADRGVRAFDPRRSPPLAKIWVWRHAVIAGLAGFAFLAISLQVYRGFGLETAIRKVVEEEFAKKAEAAATAGKPSDPQTLEYEVDQELRKYNVERSIWLDLGVSSLFLAFVSMVFAIGLDRRGAKPPPQIVIQY